MSGVGLLMDQGNPTPTAPRLKIETGGRCKHAVVSIESTSGNSRPRPREMGNEDKRRYVRVCVPLCACVPVSHQAGCSNAGLGIASLGFHERRRQQQETGRARVPTQGLPSEHRILLIFRPEDSHGGQGSESIGLTRWSWEARSDGSARGIASAVSWTLFTRVY